MSNDPGFDADLDSVGFDTAISQTGAETGGVDKARSPRLVPARRRPLRVRVARRAVSLTVIVFALLTMGGVYSLFAQTSSADETDAVSASKGHQLYSLSCITCHGANLEGVSDRGPSLRGTGGAAAYFQVATGRMPLVAQGADAERHTVYYTQTEIDELVAYVQQQGGGPAVPQGSLRDDANMAEGGELFRLNCASCHNFAGKGAPLSAGKAAPSLNLATDAEIATAMLSGPENMPVFSNNQLTLDQKKEIISYIQTLKTMPDAGGSGLDRVGPVTEGLVIWVIGIGALMAVILWIGAKS